MNLSRICIALGALLGLTGVIAGAMGAHALEEVLEPSKMDSFETAVRFQMYHALAYLALGALAHQNAIRNLKLVVWFFGMGVVLFSGSIYLLVLTPIKVGIVTPIGGSVLIVGWAVLMLSALRKD